MAIAQPPSTSLIKFTDVTTIDSIGLSLNVCGKYDTVTLYLGNKTGVQTLTNVVVNAKLVGGMHYIPGTAYVTTTLGGTTSSDPLTENVVDPQNVHFTLTNGLTNGISRYVRFLVQGDCNVFDYIGNPMYNKYSVNFNIGGTAYLNSDTVLQPYNNAFHITNIPQPTWVTNQNLYIQNGQTACRQFYIQNTTATKGSVNYLQLYDMHTPGMNVLSFGISRTASGALTPLSTIVSGDTVFAVLDSTQLAAAGFGDSLGANQRVYVTECVQVNTCTSGTWVSDIGFRWGYCFAGPCQDQFTTAAVQISIGTPNMGGSIDATNDFNKCFGSQEGWQVFYYTNTGTGPATNLSYRVDFDTTTYSALDLSAGNFQVDTTGTGLHYFTMSGTGFLSFTSNTFGGCFGATVYKAATGNIPMAVLNVGGKVLVRFKMKTCCPSSCSSVSVAGWSVTGGYQSACNPGTTLYFNSNGAMSLPVATVGMYARYTGVTSYSAGTSYTIPYTINSFTYSNWGNDANAQLVITDTFPSFFNFNPLTTNAYLQDASGNILYSSSVSSAGGVVKAIFNFPAAGAFNFHNSHFYIKVTTNACIPAACASTVYAYLGWSAQYIPDRTCASPCAISIDCIRNKVRLYEYCTSVACGGCPLDSFSFNRTSVGQADATNTGLPNGSGIQPGALLNKAMYKDTMMAYFHLQSYQKTNNGNILAFVQIPNANLLTYLGGTVSIYHHTTGLTYTCNLPAPTTSSFAGAGAGDLEYKWTINSSTVSGCSPALPALPFDSTDQVTIKAQYKVTTNVGWNVEKQGDLTPGILITNASSAADNLYSDCGWYDSWQTVGYQLYATSESNADIGTCGQGTIGSSYAYYTFLGNAGEHPFPYEYRDWNHIDNVSQNIPTGFQYVPGSARIVYQRTNGDNTYTSSTTYISPTISISGTDTVVSYDLKNNYFTGTAGTHPYSTDG